MTSVAPTFAPTISATVGATITPTVATTIASCKRPILLLGGELLAERCRIDDLMPLPSIPVLCLPPSRVDPKVLGPNVLVYHSQPGGS